MQTYSTILRFTKTVKLDIVFSENCSIVNVQISGDFFVYPEESLENLENTLKGCNTAECIEKAFSSLQGSTVLGFDVNALKRKIIEALSSCSSNILG